MTQPDNTRQPSGLPAAIGAYTIWGILPLYLLLVQSVPALEFVAWRVFFTLPVCFVIITFRRQYKELLATISNRKAMLVLVASSTLIASNWVIYIWAIQRGEIYAASLGYYINPLANVLLGTILLGERLTRLQWLAVAIATAGISALLSGALTTLWISLALALSFGSYGILRKRLDVGAVPGLTIETLLLLLPSIAILVFYATGPNGTSMAVSWTLSLSIMIGGVITAIPLLMFAIAARRMDYSTLGFIQFLAPSLVFILGLTLFDQELQTSQIVAFTLIWIAIAVFIWDQLKRRGVEEKVVSKPPPPID